MNNKFLIINNVKKFIISIENLIVTFPKKDYLSRNLIYNESLHLLENIIKANYESNNDKKKEFQLNSMVKINLIDFYLERAYKLKYISEKQLNKKSNELLKINKMIYAWYKNV